MLAHQIYNIEKIGNLLIYISGKIQNLTLTKALKLLYIIDEISVKETGTPVTWLEYKVWEKGPVAENIYMEINEYGKNWNTLHLENFIKKEKQVNKHSSYKETIILPNKEFDDSEFCDYEIELFDRVIEKYGNKRASTLINMLHEENTLWHQIVTRENLKPQFELYKSSSNYTIELSDLIVNEPEKMMAFKSAIDSLEFQNELTCNE
jgi:uncharacterized phage-associated protein